jgi:hypothetical protein
VKRGVLSVMGEGSKLNVEGILVPT